MTSQALHQKLLFTPTGLIWEKLGEKNRHGIDIPLASLHTEQSSGIGEYLDLILLIDWCKIIPLDIIQLLPINDSGNDPSPYNSFSSCALHPIYLSLHALPYLGKYPLLAQKLKEFQSYNKTKKVKYHEVRSLKTFWLREYLEETSSKFLEEKEYQEFLIQNPWLKPYGLFITLKGLLKEAHFKTWPEEFQNIDTNKMESLTVKYKKEVDLHLITQYLCFSQLKKVKSHAEKNNILLKGDIPILISPDSVEVWSHPKWFDANFSAGAPPDRYAKDGQYWGFPLFHWDEIEKDDYTFWKQRLKTANNFYDLYRIDHIVGFFRLWGIPLDRPSKEGKFFPDNEGLWKSQGKKLLEMMIRSSSMLPIGEDLGLIPHFVRECMESLGICGTKIMRWERNWEKDGSFYLIDEYPPVSMTSVSTHDSETLALWWRNREDEAKAYANFKGWDYQGELSFAQRAEILWDSHHTSSLFHINLLPEYLALFPELVHEAIEEERINIPGVVLPENWTYRLRPSLEELLTHGPLKDMMQKILFSSSPPTSIMG